jgi:hypothetical protein
VTKGLVGYWDFEEGEGGGTSDKSGEGNDGTLYNSPSWSSGIIPLSGGKTGGSALGFDGTDDYVSYPIISFTAADSWTVFLWVKEKAAGDFAGIIGREGSLTYQKIAFRNTNCLAFYDSTAGRIDGPCITTRTSWNQLGMTYSNGEIYFIVNGVFYGPSTRSSTMIFSGISPLLENRLNGFVDEVRIYNRALSAEEVRYQYNQGEPIAHWKFDEGEGTTAYDSTDNDNDGTLVNGPIWTEGKYGSALSFDGGNSIETPNLFDIGTGDVTYSLWFKKTINVGYEYLISNRDDFTGNFFRLGFDSDTGKVRFYTESTDGDNSVFVTDNDYADNDWHHLVAIRSGVVGQIFIDGILIKTGVTEDGDLGNSTDSWFMGQSGGGNGYYNGLIDDVRIYNYARTEEQIRQDYNAGLVAHIGPQSSCDRDPGSCMTEGLVGYWDFEEGEGGGTSDKSGQGNDGTLYNDPSWDTGIIPLSGGKTGGGALSFDGVDDYVNIGASSLNINSNYTISAWFKADSFSAGSGLVEWGEEAVGKRRGMIIWNGGSGSNYYLVSSTFNSNILGSTSLNTGVWYYGAVIVDSLGNAKIYLNGKEDASGTNTLNAYVYTSTNIGRTSYPEWFNGSIDEVRIYNRALSVEEVRYHYNQGGPVAHWKFDEGEGTTAYDSTNNNNDGTLTNGPTWSEGKYGSAVSFDGVDDYVGLNSNPIDLSSDFTVEAWIKKSDKATDNDRIISLVDDADNGFQFITDNLTQKYGVILKRDGVNTIDQLTYGPLDMNKWMHITYVVNGASGIFYRNGSIINSDGSTPIGTGNTNSYDIGRRSDGTVTGFFKGQVDDVRIYNYARTQEQILQDYNAGLSTHFR